jgi:hypothetical protein
MISDQNFLISSFVSASSFQGAEEENSYSANVEMHKLGAQMGDQAAEVGADHTMPARTEAEVKMLK